jgi:DnaJ-class molecular chaperone
MDCYSILEVPETASSEEIKKSYRKLSLKWHPDRNGGNSEATEKFQKLNEAYEKIGTPENKYKYDMEKQNPFHEGGLHNLDELLTKLFFGEGISLSPGLEGLGRFPPNSGTNIHMFRGGFPMHMNQKPPPIQKDLTITMETVLNGGSIPIEIERWIIENSIKVYETQTIYVSVPKGIDNNEIITLEEKGHAVSSTCKGDVKIFIKIQNDTLFKRSGLDLIYDKKISLKESLCGFSFEMKYINNVVYTINNKSGNIIPTGYQKIIPNMGITRDDHIGSLIIVFTVEFPSNISHEKIDLLKNLL